MSPKPQNFMSAEERALGERFLEQGYVVVPVETPTALDRLRREVADFAAAALELSAPDDPRAFLDGVHQRVSVEQLNDLRLAVFQRLNATDWARPLYFHLVKSALFALIGNELAMQRRINLSVQLPGDASSLLPLHADVWSGNSPFELVVWLPLVDCHDTKSMYLLPRPADAAAQKVMHRYQDQGSEAFYKAVEDDLVWMEVPFGQALIFSQALIHGNRVNREKSTRWTLNCRFKSLLSPYGDKRLTEYFDPILIRPATRLGLDYRLPQGFED